MDNNIFILSEDGKEIKGLKNKSLSHLITPDSVIKIDQEAFKGCKSLQSIIITDNVKSIGYCAFEDCNSLEDIVISDNVTSIGYNAFKGTKWLNNQPTGIVYINKVLYELKGNWLMGKPQINELIIRQGTRSISEYALLGCTSLQRVVIPDSVSNICWGAFSRCI